MRNWLFASSDLVKALDFNKVVKVFTYCELNGNNSKHTACSN